MLNLMFFVKTILITTLIVLVLQIRIGQTTLENHTEEVIRGSAVIQPLQEVAEGGAKIIKGAVNWVSKQVNLQLAKRKGKGGEEAAMGGWKRSEAYEKNRSGETPVEKSTEDHE